MDVNKTQQSFRTHFYCSLDPWDFLITFPSPFIMIVWFSGLSLIGRGNCVITQNVQRFFLHNPQRKRCLSKDYLLQVWLEALTHHPTSPIQATGQMFQTIQIEDLIKLHLNVFYWALVIFGMFCNRILAHIVEWEYYADFAKTYIQQIHEYEY
jgi:hypothetical protein